MMQNGPPNVQILKHCETDKGKIAVTALDWNEHGTMLATSSSDGKVRIWSHDGTLLTTKKKQKGPILCLKWNKEGTHLLIGSSDKAVVFWDFRITLGKWHQEFNNQSAPVLGADWLNQTTFAACSADTNIYICKITESLPIKTFVGHLGEVNAVKWDPTGSLLASCSDDGTVKIWSMKQNEYVHDLQGHTKEIYTVRWIPNGLGTSNPNQLVLASASFDSTIKLWDAKLGTLLHTLNGHRAPVFCIDFSPNGAYLASGSVDKSMHIWSVKKGKLMKTYTGNGIILDLCWSKGGDKIVLGCGDGAVTLVDFRM